MFSLRKIEIFAEQYPKSKFTLVLVISFIAFIFFNIYLGIMYENTGYPVPLIEGQTRFSAELLKSDFSVLIDKNTLSDYTLIQYLDAGIMISTAVFFTMLSLYLSRRIRITKWKRKLIAVSILFPLSSFFDLAENIFLLQMVYNPEEFPGWLAIFYSSSAVLKLFTFFIGLLSIVVIHILYNLSARKEANNGG
ncbi:MAG: hypothetical protein OEY06_05375 [Gammaproteobacteria bacterium]|nr:hypothetical protein [Gammaproteobacteria bacterium]